MKTIIIGAATFIGGGILGFFLAKKKYEAFYEALVEEEVQSVKEAFLKYERKTKVTTEEEYASADAEITQKMFEANRVAPIRSSLDNDPNERAKRNYNLIGVKPAADPALARNVDNDPEEETPTDAAGKTEIDMTIDRTAPYIIDDREFNEEFPHHEKVSLYYYREDEILAHEDEEVVEDPNAVIGMEALESLDTEATVWVRNEPMGIDYEIVALNKSYSEMVGGISLTPREKYLKQRRREDGEE